MQIEELGRATVDDVLNPRPGEKLVRKAQVAAAGLIEAGD